MRSCRSSRVAFVVVLLSASGFALAQPKAAGLEIQQFPHARVVFQGQTYDDDYNLALGSFKKTEGLWMVDHQQRLSGQLTRTTLELPSGHSAEEGFQFYSKQLPDPRTRQLYRCEGRECGPSNSWANNHFKVIQLYGLDQHQYYAAYEVNLEQQPPYYVSFYSVMRGNKRVYVQVDILHSDKITDEQVASDPDTLVKSLLANGYYVFPDLIRSDKQGNISVEINQSHLQALVTVLRRQPGLTIALVGHDYGADNLAQQQKNSSLYAEVLKNALIKQGIAEKRITAYGVGSLAPAGRGNKIARVEVVILTK